MTTQRSVAFKEEILRGHQGDESRERKRKGQETRRIPFRVLLASPPGRKQLEVARNLKKLGAQVTRVTSGRECAEKALQAQGEKPYGLILASVDLNDMDGFSVAMLLRENGYHHPIATIASTDHYENEEHSLHAGSDGHVSSCGVKALETFMAALQGRLQISATATP